MTIRGKEQSREFFSGNYNCAQSVIKALAEEAGINDYLSEALTAGFGGGMGGHQEVCGAVSGASLAISHAVFALYEDSSIGKDEARAAVGDFIAAFKKEFGKVRCYDLTGFDFSIESEKEAFVENEIKEKVCMRAVAFSTDLALKIIRDKKAE